MIDLIGFPLFLYLHVAVIPTGIAFIICILFAWLVTVHKNKVEFGAAIMAAGNIPGQTQTLSIAIYDDVQANRMEEANMMVIVLSVTTIVLKAK